MANPNILNELLSENSEYSLVSGGYTRNNKNKIILYHDACQTKFVTTINRFQQGQRCPECANKNRFSNKKDFGSRDVRKYLQDNSIFKKSEMFFEKCKSKGSLKFDFVDIYDNLIEYDGIQHFDSNKRGFATTRRHDTIKNNFCKKSKLTLLRIAYTEQKNIVNILSAFYNKDFVKLKSFDILLISPDLTLNNNKYYTRKCRSKTA